MAHVRSQLARTTCKSWFYLSCGFPGSKLRLAGLVATALTHWVLSPASPLSLNKSYLSSSSSSSFAPYLSSYNIECPTICIWVTVALSCLNWNQLSHSLVAMKPGLKSWLDSNLFSPSCGRLFWARIFLQGSSKEHHVFFSWTHTDNSAAIDNLFSPSTRGLNSGLCPLESTLCLFIWGLFVSRDRILLCSSHYH